MKNKEWTYEEGVKYGEEKNIIRVNSLLKENAKLVTEIQKLQRLVNRLKRNQPKLGLWAIRSGSKILFKKYNTRKEAIAASKEMFKPHQLELVNILEI